MKTAFNFRKLTTKTFHTGSVNSRVAHKPLLCVCVCVWREVNFETTLRQ